MSRFYAAGDLEPHDISDKFLQWEETNASRKRAHADTAKRAGNSGVSRMAESQVIRQVRKLNEAADSIRIAGSVDVVVLRTVLECLAR